MKLIDDAKGHVTLEVSREEYAAIRSALGETLEALDEWEFQTRTGVDRGVVLRLLTEFNEADPSPDLHRPPGA